MDITFEKIMSLPYDAAIVLHQKVVEFIDANNEAVLDAALMDDVLMSEYKAGVARLNNNERSEEKKELIGWLASVVWQMIECASSNIATGHQLPVYVDFVSSLSRSIK